MRKTSKKIIQDAKPRGMGLVEIVIAIGISVITLTSSVVFSTRLSMRSQQIFVEESIAQLQAIITEELRLIEQGLKRDVIATQGVANAINQGTFLPANPTASTPPRMTWAQFCNATQYNYFTINLPAFSGNNTYADHKIVVSQAVGAATTPPEDNKTNYVFMPLSGNTSFGSFKGIPVELGLHKTVTPSNTGLGNNITIKSIIRYKLYNKNKYIYTKPQEIRMVYNLVCPS